MPSIKSSKVFLKSHPAVQFDIQTLTWNKCKVENYAHTAPIMKLLSIFTLFSYKNLSLFNTCSENYKCNALLHIRKQENQSCRRNVLWLSAHMSLKEPTPHIGREFSVLSQLMHWFFAPNVMLSVHPTGTGISSPMFIQCTFTVPLSLSLVKCCPRGDILILD